MYDQSTPRLRGWSDPLDERHSRVDPASAVWSPSTRHIDRTDVVDVR
ncbi:hypothetical protein [Streptomyces spororaveus]|nr:hypothetical protein [Streptomyces spororaveus]